MFFGTTPSIITQFLKKILSAHDGRKVFVPFAGNFAVEQVACRYAPQSEIHSTDVSIYSRAIGFGLTGRDFRLGIKDEFKADFGDILDKQTPLEKAATVIFFCETAKAFVRRDKVDYYAMLYSDALANQVAYHAKILEKLEKIKEVCKNLTFYGIDAVKVLEDVKTGDLVFFDPPVDESNRDYEKQYEAMKLMLDFDDEPYTNLDFGKKIELLEQFHNAGAKVIWRLNNPRDDMPDFLRLIYSYRYKWGGEYCLYSNLSTEPFVGTWSPLRDSEKNIRLISKDDEITPKTDIRIEEIDGAIANHYRLLWVHKAQMTNGGYPFGVFADGKLIGILQVESGLKFGINFVIGQKLGCGRGTVAHYIEQYPKVKEAWLEEHEVLGDLAESKLLQKIKGGNTASIVFALTRLFPERGYGDVVQIEQEQSEKPPLALKSLSPETRAALLRDLSGQKQDEDENEAN